MPRLVNGPFDDPGLFVPFSFENRAILFDLGDISTLSPRDILKITHIFVTHTHMDHFTGFDTLLRLLLGRDKKIFLFGPKGIHENVRGKLAGYTWNLVERFPASLDIVVTEVLENQRTTTEYRCKDKFAPTNTSIQNNITIDSPILSEPALEVYAQVLDHGIPVLGFSLRQRLQVNIIKEAVESLGLEIGPWLKELKNAVYNALPNDSNTNPQHHTSYTDDPDFKDRPFEFESNKTKKTFQLKELTNTITTLTPGQEITYIADCAFTPENTRKITKLAKNTHHLYIEAAFSDADKSLALDKHHLTTKQAGEIAATTNTKELTIFHFSPRYNGTENTMHQEAKAAWLNK